MEIKTDMVRFPRSSSSAGSLKDSIINKLHDLGYGYVDWTCETGDGARIKLNEMGAYERFTKTIQNQKIAVVLMHDYSYESYDVLPKIIEYLNENNYIMLPLFRQSVMIK
jgi:peptidoglycan/xylan/chitin deacetylase (PgdA/CDA1 family)